MTKTSNTKITKVEKSASSNDSFADKDHSPAENGEDIHDSDKPLRLRKSPIFETTEEKLLDEACLPPTGDKIIDARLETSPRKRSLNTQKSAGSRASLKLNGDDDIVTIDDDLESNDKDKSSISKPSIYETPKKMRASKTTAEDDETLDIDKEENNAQISMAIVFDDDVVTATHAYESQETESQETASETHDQSYDELASTTFVVTKLFDVVDRKFLDSAGISILKPVLNAELATAECEKLVISIWGDNANNVHSWLETNVIENKTVCCMPQKNDLCDPTAERFINTDASSYLQFLPRRATASQKTFYGVENCYVLATDRPNSRQNDLVIHPHALPIILEWPSYDYYTVGGNFIPKPELWGANHSVTPAVVDYNFETKSPVKAFSPKFNHKKGK